MPTVIVSSYKVANFADGGGHFWVYMQYIHGLRRAGCDVYWMEQFRPGVDAAEDERAVATFFERARRFGLADRVFLHVAPVHGAPRRWIGVPAPEAEAAIRGADLVLNFHYAIAPDLLAWGRRTVLMDIDPGLLQIWMGAGQLSVPPHDLYFSTGETVGTPRARFPDCGVRWIYSPPPVCLDWWVPTLEPAGDALTTVSGWWSGKWVRLVEDGREVLRENTKRAAFLPFLDLPRHTRQPLELALDLAVGDASDRRMFEERGWRIRHSREVARTPETYQAYIQRSRGEFSAAKPSCMWFQNAWVSDRTLCYLASGKPAVVQHTGPSTFLPHGAGMFRFRNIEEAAAAIRMMNADYARHCRAARALAEEHFDASRVVKRILEVALS